MKTKIISVKEGHAAAKAATILKKGGIIVYPTETCYGIGADITNKRAVKMVFIVKHMPKDKKISMIVSGLKMAKKYTRIGKKEAMLIKKLLPGPLTVIPEDGRSFRIPDNRFVLNMIRKFGKPITGTSANLSGAKSIYKISEIKKYFHGKVNLIIDGGNLTKAKPSTVFGVENMKVLRRGSITRREIMECLNNI
ncbi:MAG: L-threonylcarbamoyladenylate synthase [Candidatus Aenigmatarchaeota archaeon]